MSLPSGSGGVLLGVHAGFNPGELLDFLLGFVGIDLYGDDVAKVAPPNDHPPQPRRNENPPR